MKFSLDKCRRVIKLLLVASGALNPFTYKLLKIKDL